MITATKGAESTLPVLGHKTFIFAGAGYKEYIFSVNKSVVNMEYKGIKFEAIGLIFKNQTNVDWTDFRLVFFHNESRLPKPTPEENGLQSQDPDLGIFEWSKLQRKINIAYPFALKDENGTWLDDPNSIKLVLYYFGDEAVTIDLEIQFGFVAHRDETSTSNSLPIPFIGILVPLLSRKPKSKK